ncbi:MAG TPA: undecaprenyl-phosphate glucose phosphotransferase [Chloroflexia bacterium]|nr:undecaprenyl-phosphate glucose phosphotransferase [Chloroflexia bacterium]
MQNPLRAITGGNKNPPIPQTMAASHAPIAEPKSGNGARGRATGSPQPISPTEAERVARQAQQARIERSQRAAPAQEPVAIPALPPAQHAPLRLTPVVLMLVQMVFDIVAIAGAFGAAYWLRFEVGLFDTFGDLDIRHIEPDVQTYATMMAITVGTLLTTFYFSKLYSLKRGASRVDEFYKIAAAVSMGTVLSLAINSLILGKSFEYSREVLLTGWLLSIVFVTVMRLLYSVMVGQLRKAGVDRARVLVVGAGPTAAVVVDRLEHHPTLGYEVLGMVDHHTNGSGEMRPHGHVPVLGNITRLAEIVRKRNVDEVIVALSGASDKQLRDIITLVQDESVSVKIYPDAFQLMTQNEVSVGELSGLPLLSVKDVALRGWNRRLKRAFDVVFSLLVLVLTAPLMLFIAIAIKLTSSGPVFFIQERVGLDGTPFQLVKFRTMKMAVDEDEVPKLIEGMPGWTVPNDPRRTSIGTFLRRFSLDELPQFYNVLMGEMSVVGPRPEQPEYVKQFAQRIPHYLRRHREKSGITGWAQVNGLRGDSSIELRTAADIYYVENWSLLFDLKIIVRTIVAMFRGKNAY